MRNKDSRVKYNLISSIIYQVVFIGLGFIIPRLYLEKYGSDVNGVLSTIKQIFTYLFLLEAGVGLATTQALYKYIGKKDYNSMSAILSATHSYYIKTGIIYFAIVLIIAVVYAFIVPTGIDSWIVFSIVILNAVPSLFAFFVQAKYRILMEADGRKYVINNSETIVQLVSNFAKVLVLLLTDSLVLIQLVYCIIALVQLGLLYLYAKRRYKWLNLKVKPDFKSISQKNSVLVHQISGMVFNNTDVILLSVLTDFKTVSIYTVYNIFFSQVQNFITTVVSGFNFALGQMFNEDRERFDRIFRAYETAYIMTTFIIYTLMAVFILPLIQIYTKGITDTNYTNVYLVVLFVVMNLIANGKLPANTVLEYCGGFSETRSHAIWEMIINITVSVVAIMWFGVCGAILGTVVALIYRSIVMIYYTNKKVLGKSVMQTYGCWIINGAIFALIMVIFFVDNFSNVSFVRLVLNGILHSLWIVGIYVGVNFLVRRDVFVTLWELCRGNKK